MLATTCILASKNLQVRMSLLSRFQKPNGEIPKFFLYKADPLEFSIDDLKSCKDETDMWDGVRNHVAKRNIMAGQKGDMVLFYHSNNKKETGIVGMAEIVSEKHYPDPTDNENKGWQVVDMKFKEKWPRPVTLIDIKEAAKDNDVLSKMQLFTTARLSVQKVTAEEAEIIESMRIANEDAGVDAPAHKKARKA